MNRKFSNKFLSSIEEGIELEPNPLLVLIGARRTKRRGKTLKQADELNSIGNVEMRAARGKN